MKMHYEPSINAYIPDGQTPDTMYKGDAMADQVLSITGRFMDEPEPSKPDATHWVTKDGERLTITEMDDDHLRNTIRMLRRKADVMKLSEMWNMGMYMETAPDGAYDACESAMQQFEDMTPDQYLTMKIPCFTEMLRQAVTRKLELGEVA